MPEFGVDAPEAPFNLFGLILVGVRNSYFEASGLILVSRVPALLVVSEVLVIISLRSSQGVGEMIKGGLFFGLGDFTSFWELL